jgi:hypothetical protein
VANGGSAREVEETDERQDKNEYPQRPPAHFVESRDDSAFLEGSGCVGRHGCRASHDER